jgi:hypothetical protein
MTIETLFLHLVDHRLSLTGLIFCAPWVAYFVCVAIPGKREEPFVLSINLGLAIISSCLLVGYLAYAVNLGGWRKVVTEADVLLLILPIYHLPVSLWLSSYRLPLELIPAYRTLKGLTMIAVMFVILSWLAAKVRILLFSYIPFSTFLFLLAIVLGIGYAGYRYIAD